jgi:uncharacterized membrane protein YjjP (DUF1212 family)
MEPQTAPWADKNVHAVLTLVVGLVANQIAKRFGVSLNVEEISAFALTIVAFIVSHKWAGAAKAKAAAAAEVARGEIASLEKAANVIGDSLDKQ